MQQILHARATYRAKSIGSHLRLVISLLVTSDTWDHDITARLRDMVACLGNSDLDGLRADCRGSDNLVASDRDDLVGAAARRCWVVVAALR